MKSIRVSLVIRGFKIVAKRQSYFSFYLLFQTFSGSNVYIHFVIIWWHCLLIERESKLLTILIHCYIPAGIICSFLLTELVQLSQVRGPSCSDTLFQFSPQRFYGIQVKALWWLLQYFHFVVVKPFCYNFRSLLGIIVLLQGPIVSF